MDVRGWWDERSQGEKVAVVAGGLVCLAPALVAVAVVASAVVGSFVLGMGEPATTQTPQIRFDFETRDGGSTVTVTHAGGETVEADSLFVVVDGRTTPWPGAGEVAAGDQATVDAGAGASVRVVWRGPDGERATIGSFTVPR